MALTRSQLSNLSPKDRKRYTELKKTNTPVASQLAMIKRLENKAMDKAVDNSSLAGSLSKFASQNIRDTNTNNNSKNSKTKKKIKKPNLKDQLSKFASQNITDTNKSKRRSIDQEGGVGQGLPITAKGKKNPVDQEGGVGQGLPITAKNNKKVNKKTTKSPSLDFLTPKGKKQVSSILSKLKRMFDPKERITSTKIKKNLPKDETYSKKQIEQLRVALTPSDKRKSPGHPSIRAKAPVVKKKVTSIGKKKLNANELEKLNKIKPRGPKPTQPAKITSKRTQDEKDAGAGKFTGKTPGYTPRGNKESMNRTKETKKAAPKKESFLGFEKVSGPKGMFIAPAGVRKMKTPFGGTIEVDSTPIKDREDRKAGGKVSKKKGGMIKRSMGGPAKPRKKTVFRRGGGKALRGFGKATYSNKMY